MVGMRSPAQAADRYSAALGRSNLKRGGRQIVTLGACHCPISAEPPRGDYFAPGFIVDCARHVDSRRRRSALWRTRVMVARAGPPATICCEPRQARKVAAAATEK